VSQRAFVVNSASPLTHALDHGSNEFFHRLSKLQITSISAICYSKLCDFRHNEFRFDTLSVVSQFRRLFSKTISGVFGGILPRSISTIFVVTFQFLPLLSVLSSSVSVISDMRIQRFPLWLTLSGETLKTICPLRPFGRNFLEKLALILLDRNHFLVLVNGRSPP
jgi:hypothetical protein